MRDTNPIRTLGDYSKPSHEGYRNTIKLRVGNNVVPLRSDTIRLVQNGCSFHGLWTAKLCNDIMMFQQHHGESLSKACTRFKNLLQKVPHHCVNLCLQVQIFYNYVNPVIRRTIDQSTGDKLRDRNAKESQELLEDLALYDNESWNNPKNFAKPVKAISLPQDVPSTSDCHLIELKNQVQCLMEARLALTQPTQSSGTEFVCTKGDDDDIMFIEIVKKDDGSHEEEPKAEGLAIMRRKLDPMENSDRGVSNFTGRIKRMHVHIGNFTYVMDFIIVEDISSVIDSRLSRVVLGKPFIEMSNMTHDPPKGVSPHCMYIYPAEFMLGVIVFVFDYKLYLMRRSLEILRKFHLMILGRRFNQLSHVSSPLLSKPGEYKFL
nr:MAK10-like protein [Tanacetum cinerariifolium]